MLAVDYTLKNKTKYLTKPLFVHNGQSLLPNQIDNFGNIALRESTNNSGCEILLWRYNYINLTFSSSIVDSNTDD